MPAVAVVGGSLGGLTAALVLRDIGCDVTVHERSTAALQARGAGTAKAAEDGWVLAEELQHAGGDVPAALAAWEPRQLALGAALLARTREIDDSSPVTGGFRPGDRRLIFGLHAPGR